MCRPTANPPTPGWGYRYGQGWINPTRTRTLLYPAAVPGRVQQPVTIPMRDTPAFHFFFDNDNRALKSSPKLPNCLARRQPLLPCSPDKKQRGGLGLQRSNLKSHLLSIFPLPLLILRIENPWARTSLTLHCNLTLVPNLTFWERTHLPNLTFRS